MTVADLRAKLGVFKLRYSYCVDIIELTAQDCLFMGKHAFNAGAYARAVEWFEESYILAGLEKNATVRQDQVMEFIQYAVNMVRHYR